jgi:hypothetical protein
LFQNKCGNHRQTAQTSRSASAKDEEDQALASCVKDKYGLIKCNGGLRKGNKKKDFCFFCNEYVLNFSRHIQRNHSSEIEVQRILSLAPNTAERKQQLMILRKKGNFLVSTEIPKAVRSPMVEKNLRPCDYCLGMYSSRQLWRHKKKCASKNTKKANIQNLFLHGLRIDTHLRNTVFPKMRQDEVSVVAQKDMLICAFAARYMRIHREKHFVNVTSRKMRELGRLVIQMKKIEPTINCLLDALRPKYFDCMVAATKVVAKYNDKTETYESPTYAMNIATTLTQCCDIAIVRALKRKQLGSNMSAAEMEAELKTTIHLIKTQWRFEISSQALGDLNINKWNKITLVPLASDLKLLKNYLIKKAENAITSLEKKNNSCVHYKELLETIFCRVMLLNRRRPGELQRMTYNVYQKIDSNVQSYEEFGEVVSPSEKILLQKFKRVVIRGKRGRGVPVLFSTDVREHIDILLKYRTSCMKKENVYLFGNPNTTESICGYKVLKKYATLCGAKNPDAISATKLRKHLATLTQLFSMSDNDIEQLATFMGHTVGVHRGSYRLPDDVYQTAKISKLLLLMEEGKAGQYKGKPLSEIDINLDDDLLAGAENCDANESETELEPIVQETTRENNGDQQSSEHISNISPSSLQSKIRKKRILVPWTDHQKQVVKKHFASHIRNKKPPKRKECEELKKLHKDLLENKDWLKIKVFVQNQYVKK